MANDFDDFMRDFASMLGMAYRDYGPGESVAARTKVYRVEMPNGHGPFNSGLRNAEAIYQHICSGEPGFTCDRLERANGAQMGLSDHAFEEANGECEYGCETVRDVCLWFPRGSREYLDGLGARCVVYEVQPGDRIARCGNGEVLFCLHRAKRTTELRLTELPEPKLPAEHRMPVQS